MRGSFVEDDENRSAQQPHTSHHTTLSPQFTQAYISGIPVPSIGVWGPPGTGKSVLLSSGLHHLQHMPIPDSPGDNSLGIRWGYEVGIPRWLDTEDPATFKRSDNFLTNMVAAFGDGKLPQATRLASNTERVLLELVYRDSRDGFSFKGRIGRRHVLEIMDDPGELIFRDDHEDIYWQRLRACRGIMLIINGNNLNGSYQRDFETPNRAEKYGYNMLKQSFFNKVCLNGNLPFVAVCITQMDANTTVQGYKDVWEKQNDEGELKRLLNEITGINMYDAFKHKFGNRFRVFLTSATGWAYEDVDFKYQYVPNVTQDPKNKIPILIDKRATPLNVLHALLWLLDCVEYENWQHSLPKGFINRIFQRYIYKQRISNLSILKTIYNKSLGYLP